MAVLDVINRALSDIGARVVIADYLTETTPAAKQARLWYDVCRKRLLRAAPWGFARRTLLLTELNLATDNPNLVPYPWLVEYEWPGDDCMKLRYILPPPTPPGSGGIIPPDVSSMSLLPIQPPSRNWRFLPNFSPGEGEDPAAKTLLANVREAYCVYTADVEDDDLWDPLFMAGLEAMLSFHFVMPLTGNAKMKGYYQDVAREVVAQARAVDGNEAIPSADHVVDWMAARVVSSGYYAFAPGLGGDGPGLWYDGYDLNWGM